MGKRLGLLWVCWVAAACSPAPSGLTVDLRTDMRAVEDFDSVQTEVSSTRFTTTAASGRVTNTPVTSGADLLRGVRVADLPDLGNGTWYVRVSLLAPTTHTPVLQRTTELTLTTRYALTVVIARSCVTVSCPQTGDDPAATECRGGACVTPRCAPETPEFCPPPQCTTDNDCHTGTCGRGTCADGACLVTRDDTACAGGSCRFDYTCVGVPDASITDAGPSDAGPIDAGHDVGIVDAGSCTARETLCTNAADDDCDGLQDCADPDCDMQACDDGNACTHHDHCSASADACMGTAIACVDEPCRAHACNGTDTCSSTNAPDLIGCPDDGNPCTADFCASGTCAHLAVADDTSYDGMYYHRCCGGVPTQTGTDSHCDSCGNDCGGQGCFTFLGIASCRCPVSDAFCTDRNRGFCYDSGDGNGWLCQPQDPTQCSAGQSYCPNPGPRHFCFFGSC